jgi:hypothetical protein
VTAGLLRPQVILSLCDYSGTWSQPYVDDNYDVRRIDLRDGQDVRLLELPIVPVHGVLAAPPCTVFANSGARWERSETDMLEGLSIVDACCRLILMLRPTWWVLENPAGKLSRWLGPPAMTFQPSEYGDPYTKFTCLWGNFRAPTRTLVEATLGSKMHLLPPSEERAQIRSQTPAGFAQAFFEANP